MLKALFVRVTARALLSPGIEIIVIKKKKNGVESHLDRISRAQRQGGLLCVF